MFYELKIPLWASFNSSERRNTCLHFAFKISKSSCAFCENSHAGQEESVLCDCTDLLLPLYTEKTWQVRRACPQPSFPKPRDLRASSGRSDSLVCVESCPLSQCLLITTLPHWCSASPTPKHTLAHVCPTGRWLVQLPSRLLARGLASGCT